MLSAFEYLTTREVCEYLALPGTKRAVERRLQRLRLQGYVRAELLNPARGMASERRWSLLKKGQGALEVTYESHPSSPSPKAGSRREVTPREAAVLHLLAEMKHLTTGQIRCHLHDEKSNRYTWRLLGALQREGYIRGKRMYPEMGAASECYWTIRKAGAATIGIVYDRRYLRRPARRTIEHRGLLLEMSRQVEAAGWQLIKPQQPSRQLEGVGVDGSPGAKRSLQENKEHTVHTVHKPGHRAGDTPQRERLVEAALHYEAMSIQRLVEQGYHTSEVRDRIERLKAGQVGALVPRAPNDYVAYVPGRPKLTAVLIPHPTWAGRAYWVRRPGVRRDIMGRKEGIRARLDKYARLAKVLPVIGVFSTDGTARQYAALLASGGLHSVTVGQVGDKLASLAHGDPEYGKPEDVLRVEREVTAVGGWRGPH